MLVEFDRNSTVDALHSKIMELENTVRLLRIELSESRQIVRDMVNNIRYWRRDRKEDKS